jgi:predicted ATPase/class 3 adenylate cyclase
MTLLNLPTGTVTFLFTDIEGSTQLWELYPDQMRATLIRHDRIIEGIVGLHGGSVVRPRGEGDSRFAVFSRATDAVTAAAAMQQALHAEPWPAPVSLQVRLALHTGEADLREGDYYGSAVNRCARLRAVAHGGQALVSNATQQLVHDSLPEGVTLQDLGEHRLKDLQRPERIFQVVAPGLPADFPPLKSLDNLPNNLPVQLTSFVGREREMEEVKRLLAPESAQVPPPAGSAPHPREGTRLLTLTGPGGTGKTRLALQVAAQLLDSYPDGVWLVELAPVADALLVPQAVALALGVREVTGSSQTDRLVDHLRPKTTLLLLDNCEHVVEECARLVGALLGTCQHLSVLASSREPLGIGGELPYRVPSLSLPDPGGLPDLDTLPQYEAVGLFIERAHIVEPSFELTEQNAAAVTEICRRLDGIPLALELAAARVRVLSVEQIAARLDDRFRLLTGGSRTAVPRQQTLQAAMDWSYDLLSDQERALLRRLSVFMSGWSLEGAEAVCAGESIETLDVLDVLSHLVDKSLVVVEQPELRVAQEPAGGGEVRYRLLETVRQYARDKLMEAGETERVRDRHFDYFLRLAEELEPQTFGPDAKVGLDRLEAEHDNLRAALEWSLTGGEGRDAEKALPLAGALGNFWYWRGYLNEGRQWLERAVALPISAARGPELGNEDRSRLVARGNVLLGAGTLAWMQADTELARVRLEESVAIQRQFGDKEHLAQALHILGHAHFDQLDYVGARSLFEESLSLFRQVGNTSIGPSLVGDLGTVAYNVGDYPTARRFLEQSLLETREVHSVQSEAQMLSRLGDLTRSEGDFERAAEVYEALLVQARKVGAPLLMALGLHRLGQIARHRGDFAKAASLLKESLKMHREAGNKPGIAECLAALAGLAASEGRLDGAVRLFGAADALLERIKVPLTPADRAQHDGDLAAARSQVDGQAWEIAWTEGRTMGLEQAIEFALNPTQPGRAGP